MDNNHGESNMNHAYCVITTTVDQLAIAEKISESVIQRGLAACVQIIPEVTSYYRWQGKVEKAQEYLLQFKTQQSLSDELMTYIKTVHAYEVPEIISTRIDKIDPGYEKWLTMATNKDLS